MKRLRILALMHPQLVPPDSLEGQSEKEINVWKTEYDVVNCLRTLGHEVRPLGVQYELLPLREAVEQMIAVRTPPHQGRGRSGSAGYTEPRFQNSTPL